MIIDNHSSSFQVYIVTNSGYLGSISGDRDVMCFKIDKVFCDMVMLILCLKSIDSVDVSLCLIAVGTKKN